MQDTSLAGIHSVHVCFATMETIETEFWAKIEYDLAIRIPNYIKNSLQ